jgi:tRNA threonylcarbamoyl adenosine modification protein YeaZ
MRILALETTDKTGSVAAMADGNLLAELTLEPTQRSAQSLAPALQQLLQQVGWQPADVQLVAVSIGPGSFTGLRVGVTAAKVFAYAVGAEVLGISTLEAIAANTADLGRQQGGTAGSSSSAGAGIGIDSLGRLTDTTGQASSATLAPRMSVVIDAQRGDVVAQDFVRQQDGRLEAVAPEELLDADTWLARLQEHLQGPGAGAGGQKPETPSLKSEISNPQISRAPNPRSPYPDLLSKGEAITVTGPGLARLLDRLPPGVEVLPERLWRPRAAVVGRLAVRYHAEGRRDDLWKLVPRYYRRSAAEEKWEARMGRP